VPIAKIIHNRQRVLLQPSCLFLDRFGVGLHGSRLRRGGLSFVIRATDDGTEDKSSEADKE